ncbi:MAG: hypothetical protein HGA31_06535 [Candidatus Moranbacteria bacterium]|nr:hypothetical protein [Candidatus Moranbacteria bacterium]
MTSIIRIALICLSALTIIIADSMIKKISMGQTFSDVLKDPRMIPVYVLYLLQIFLAVPIFLHEGELAIYANLFIVFYGIFSVVFGVYFFRENLSIMQMLGIGLGLIGAVLMGS